MQFPKCEERKARLHGRHLRTRNPSGFNPWRTVGAGRGDSSENVSISEYARRYGSGGTSIVTFCSPSRTLFVLVVKLAAGYRHDTPPPLPEACLSSGHSLVDPERGTDDGRAHDQDDEADHEIVAQAPLHLATVAGRDSCVEDLVSVIAGGDHPKRHKAGRVRCQKV